MKKEEEFHYQEILEILKNQNKSKEKKVKVKKKSLKMTHKKKYTLILDLDETLVHFKREQEGGQVLLRPYVHFFLEEMSKFYELIIFTASQKDYADWIIDRLDRKKLISKRLYRDHVEIKNGVCVKVS